jgi:hypothetical protein
VRFNGAVEVDMVTRQQAGTLLTAAKACACSQAPANPLAPRCCNVQTVLTYTWEWHLSALALSIITVANSCTFIRSFTTVHGRVHVAE